MPKVANPGKINRVDWASEVGVKLHQCATSVRTTPMIPRTKPAKPNFPPCPACREYRPASPPSPNTKANQKVCPLGASPDINQNRPLNAPAKPPHNMTFGENID